MKGIPVRLEIGPKDMEKQQCCIARRDTGEKTFVPLAGLEDAILAVDAQIQALSNQAALDTARAEAVRVIREEYNAPAGEIKKTMTVKKATKRTLQARLTLKGRMSVELVYYGARPAAKAWP